MGVFNNRRFYNMGIGCNIILRPIGYLPKKLKNILFKLLLNFLVYALESVIFVNVYEGDNELYFVVTLVYNDTKISKYLQHEWLH